MKRLILIGHVACGKTTILQALHGEKLEYHKTQALDVVGTCIDTPGEYLELRAYSQALVVTAVDADVVVFVQDASSERFMFSPGHAASFSPPVIGVVSKIDIATEKQIAQAEELLRLAGADPVFRVSAFTGEGLQELLAYLDEDGQTKAGKGKQNGKQK